MNQDEIEKLASVMVYSILEAIILTVLLGKYWLRLNTDEIVDFLFWNLVGMFCINYLIAQFKQKKLKRGHINE